MNLVQLLSALAPLFTKGHKSKTVIFAALLAFFTGVQVFVPSWDFLGPYGPAVTGVIALIVAGLRLVTDSSLGEK